MLIKLLNAVAFEVKTSWVRLEGSVGRTDDTVTIDHAYQHFPVVILFFFGFIQGPDSDEACHQ